MSLHALIRKLEEVSGIMLKDKEYLVESRIADVLKKRSLARPDDLVPLMSGPDGEKITEEVIQALSIGETRFFRDEVLFDALSNQIIPEWLDRDNARGGSGILSIWSAACSTGQEPYSIAMTIFERFPQIANRLSILASDIAPTTLQRARMGVYTDFEIKRGVSPARLTRFFTAEADGFRIKDEVRAKVSFLKLNLLTDRIPGFFHVIFCKNVLIYFSESNRKILYDRLAAAMQQDGVMILGTGESPLGVLPNVLVRVYATTHYYELNSSNVTIFKKPQRGDQP